MTRICRICLESGESEEYQINEMMFGINEKFSYHKCKFCGCLQITNIPSDLSRFYPINYYSFNENPLFKKNPISLFLTYCRVNYFLFKKNLIGYFLGKIHPNPVMELIGKTGINKSSKILDVGSGRGIYLYNMHIAGMKNLLGIDPFLDSDIEYKNGLKILKKNLS